MKKYITLMLLLLTTSIFSMPGKYSFNVSVINDYYGAPTAELDTDIRVYNSDGEIIYVETYIGQSYVNGTTKIEVENAEEFMPQEASQLGIFIPALGEDELLIDITEVPFSRTSFRAHTVEWEGINSTPESLSFLAESSVTNTDDTKELSISNESENNNTSAGFSVKSDNSNTVGFFKSLKNNQGQNQIVLGSSTDSDVVFLYADTEAFRINSDEVLFTKPISFNSMEDNSIPITAVDLSDSDFLEKSELPIINYQPSDPDSFQLGNGLSIAVSDYAETQLLFNLYEDGSTLKHLSQENRYAGYLKFEPYSGSFEIGSTATHNDTGDTVENLTSHFSISKEGLVDITDSLEVGGSISASTLNGNGASITDINANNISNGILSDNLLSDTVTNLGDTIESDEITSIDISKIDNIGSMASQDKSNVDIDGGNIQATTGIFENLTVTNLTMSTDSGTQSTEDLALQPKINGNISSEYAVSFTTSTVDLSDPSTSSSSSSCYTSTTIVTDIDSSKQVLNIDLTIQSDSNTVFKILHNTPAEDCGTSSTTRDGWFTPTITGGKHAVVFYYEHDNVYRPDSYPDISRGYFDSTDFDAAKFSVKVEYLD